MNFLPKGTLTVIMATIVASSLILFSGNTVADSTGKSNDDVALKAKADAIKLKDKELQESTSTLVTKVISPPPPGPFALEKSAVITKVEPAAPTNAKVAPKLKETQSPKPKKLKEIVFKRMQPSMPVAPTKLVQPIPAIIDKNIEAKLPELRTPELVKEKPPIPAIPQKVGDVILEVPKPVLTTKMPAPTQAKESIAAPSQPKNTIKEPSEPIWAMKPPIRPTAQISRGMPQQYGVNQPRMPRWPNNIRWNPRGNQQYMYVPMPVYPPSFAYPQMPMNINGYPFAGEGFNPQLGSVRQGSPVNTPKLGSPKPIEKDK